MKLLTLALAATAVLFAAKPAEAQTPVYDTLGGATSVSYTTQPGATLGGDNFLAAISNVSQVKVLFVATAAGTYGVSLDLWTTNCLGTATPPPLPSINIPAGGAFPSAWIVTFNASTPVSGLFGASVNSSSSNFVPGYNNVADSVGANDTDGFSIDANQNGTLEPCPPGTEFFTFNAAWTNANLLMTASSVPSPLFASHGPALGGSSFEVVDVQKVEMPIHRVRGVLSLIDPKNK